MTAVSAQEPVMPNEGRGRFLGSRGECWRILAHDMLALIVTLGIYRFWVSTNIRRYMWSRTELAGEQLDYTGDPIELLLGFLALVVVLAPVMVISAAVSWASGHILLVVLATYVPVILLAPLAVLAFFQARRYRVNHTVFRGLRFRQTGSGLIFVLLIALWAIVLAVTLGLAYPWARASLERYKMNNTHYGNLRASFVGTGWDLFKRGFPLWLAMWGSLAVFLMALSAVTPETSADDLVGFGMLWLVFAIVVFYPFFRAMALRWRIAGIRLGTLSLQSEFRTWGFAKAYLKFYAWLLLLMIIVTVLGLFAIGLAEGLANSLVAEFIGVLLLVIAYFAIATLVAFAYQATVRLETWRLIVDSLVLRGTDQLNHAMAPAEPVSRRRGRIGAAINLGGF